MKFKELRVEAYWSDTQFAVQGKKFGIWWNAYIYTRYFKMFYDSREDAHKDIENYLNRYSYHKTKNTPSLREVLEANVLKANTKEVFGKKLD